MSASRRAVSAAFCLALLVAFAVPARAQSQTVTVFAAASMREALDAVDKAYMQEHKDRIVVSYAASSALAKQIAQGAPADLFISADLKWMDYLAKANLIEPARRVNLLGNTLVMIAPADSKLSHVTIDASLDLDGLTHGGRIAVADTRAVPAGLYAKAALTKLGLWSKAAPKLAMAENVRAALALVARAEAPIGIVYSTDAKAEPKVKIVGTFPADSHPPIIYPMAVTAKAKPATDAYYDFLRTDKAKAIFSRYGFAALDSGS